MSKYTPEQQLERAPLVAAMKEKNRINRETYRKKREDRKIKAAQLEAFDIETIYRSDLLYVAAHLYSGEKVFHILKSRKASYIVGKTITEAEFEVFMSTYYGTQGEA